jgi:hypothetical protein
MKKQTSNMKILKIEDYNYSIVYVEDKNESSVYKRFVDGNWMYLKGNNWSSVKNVDELEKLFKKRNMIKLFLDDCRQPKDAINLIPSEFNKFYWENDWVVVKNYTEFVRHIEKNGIPGFVSFDHDLADFHYDYTPEDYENMTEEEMITKFGSIEKTGLDCAKFLVEYCESKSENIPEYLVHSANPIGKENIQKFLENAKKFLK